VESRLFLNVVVGESAAVLKLFASEDEALLVWGNALLVCRSLDFKVRKWREQRTLNLGLHIVDGVRRLHLKGDSLAREGLHENLHVGLGVRSVMCEVAGRREEGKAGVFKHGRPSRNSAS
jgi:hypothetical protein